MPSVPVRSIFSSELAHDLAYGIGRLRDARRLFENDRLLRESEERFRLAFEQNMAPMLFVDLDDASSPPTSFLSDDRVSREDLIGRDSTPFTHPDDVGITEESTDAPRSVISVKTAT